MKVYRLERNGLGPFTQYTTTRSPFSITCEDVKYKKGDNKNCFLYGSDCPEKLKEYFGYAYAELLEDGFAVKVYDVPKRRIRYSPNEKQLSFMEAPMTELASIYALRKALHGDTNNL